MTIYKFVFSFFIYPYFSQNVFLLPRFWLNFNSHYQQMKLFRNIHCGHFIIDFSHNLILDKSLCVERKRFDNVRYTGYTKIWLKIILKMDFLWMSTM